MDIEALAKGFAPLQENLRKTQAKRASESVEGTAGGGAVKVRLRGDLTVAGVSIAPAAAGDAPMLEDLVSAALNDALRQHKARYGATVEEQFNKVLAGADLSSLMGPLMGMLGGRR